MAETMPTSDDILPALRCDLSVVGRSNDPRGEPVWIVFDPLRNRYLELRPLAYEILSRWRLGSVRGVTEAISRETSYRIGAGDVLRFIKFLSDNQLLNQRRSPAKPKGRSAWNRFHQLLSVLVFFRIRLLRPDRALGIIAEVFGFLFRRWFWSLVGIIGTSGILLVAHQWDSFIHTFADFLNLQGLVIMVSAVVFSKVVHELGHALSAKHLGCRVPSMGLAFILGAPLAYTDVSDTWRLLRRRDRLLVSSGGVLAETALAGLVTWGWLILPDGSMRSACFVIATTSWIATLVLNLNPFMRFDGYYILADLTGLRNLQERSFAMGRWALRRSLLGWHQAAPETAGKRLSSFLIGFAWVTWCVRATVFVGLALLAYFMFGKVLGTLIAVIEIWLLVAGPIFREFGTWLRERKAWIGQRRAKATMALSGFMLLFACIPQSYRMALPAVLVPAEQVWVHAAASAIVANYPLSDGPVTMGDTVLRQSSPDLEHQIAQVRRRLAIGEMLLQQTAVSQMAARQQGILAQERDQQASVLRGLLAQQARLTVVAPFNGRVADIDPELKVGSWVAPDLPLFLIVGEGPPKLRAFVDDRDRSLLEVGRMARFYPEASEYPVMDGIITDVQSVPQDSLVEPLLASVNGGEIPVRTDDHGQLVPEHGLYQVTIVLNSESAKGPKINAILRGRVYCDSKPYAIVGLLVKRLRAIVSGEFGI